MYSECVLTIATYTCIVVEYVGTGCCMPTGYTGTVIYQVFTDHTSPPLLTSTHISIHKICTVRSISARLWHTFINVDITVKTSPPRTTFTHIPIHQIHTGGATGTWRRLTLIYFNLEKKSKYDIYDNIIYRRKRINYFYLTSHLCACIFRPHAFFPIFYKPTLGKRVLESNSKYY